MRLYAISILAMNERTGVVRHYVTATWAHLAPDHMMRGRFLAAALSMPQLDPRDGWARHDVRWEDITEMAMEGR